ncbi:MAG: ribonuclease E/G [Flavobacteriaceae bacterium]
MSNNKMLIDATHPEETRVVVLRGSKVEEFDFESASRRQLRGNIYLAKVTRVEPSLQAAFVDYGGNRHGFLAFSEIHPDYYQIPVADRERLLQEDEDDEADHEAREEQGTKSAGVEDAISAAAESEDNGDDESDGVEEVVAEDAGEESVESVGSEDAMEEVPQRRQRQRRHYKIQEVIKRRQILLVQVVKEERGNKGAALTTYLSLAGRYCVLMPNTARGGGISRKITSAADRKRLKEIAVDLTIPKGMGVILRTAGASRTKAEIKRDFEYLSRLWENVRELTMKSVSPALVYEEGSLVKRSIRDLYDKEISEIIVAGEDAYKDAKDFMRMLMPSHARNVKAYREPTPLFERNGIEAQLDAMFNPQVTLKSGGYLVMNQTEALVSIDVNSGRSTREHNIEDTALKTNLEAADEVARQLRLRDLAGLIVIDFIDMEENRNNRAVEKRLKEALKHDRARIQVGRISPFGLLEMSRQRIRSGLLEGSLKTCPHCHGTGHIRSTESIALHILRSVEAELIKKPTDITVETAADAALYILNQKRASLNDLETRFGASILINANGDLGAQLYRLERGADARGPAVQPLPVTPDDHEEPEDEEEEAMIAESEEEEEASGDGAQEVQGEGGRRRRRRRRRGGDRNRTENAEQSEQVAEADDSGSDASGESRDEEDETGENGQPKRRRRGRRGGRRRRERRETTEQDAVTAEGESWPGDSQDTEPPLEVAAAAPDSEAAAEPVPAETVAAEADAPAEGAGEEAPPAKKRATRSRRKKTDDAEVTEEAAPKPRSRGSRKKAPPAEEVAAADAAGDEAQPDVVDEPVRTEAEIVPMEPAQQETAAESQETPAESSEPRKPPRRGWWQRRG